MPTEITVVLTDPEAATLLKIVRETMETRIQSPRISRRLDSALEKIWMARWKSDRTNKLSGTKFFGLNPTVCSGCGANLHHSNKFDNDMHFPGCTKT